MISAEIKEVHPGGEERPEECFVGCVSAHVEDCVVKSAVPSIEMPDADFSEFIRRLFKKHGHRIALVDDATGECHSYAALLDEAGRLATGLHGLGFRPGHVAGVCGARGDKLLLAFIAAVLAGGSVVFAKTGLTYDETERQFKGCQVTTIFCDVSTVDTAKEVRKNLPSVTTLVVVDDGQPEGAVSLERLLGAHQASQLRAVPRASPESPLTVFYSSGTTGKPKGVVASHRNWMAQLLASGHENSRMIRRSDVIVATAPVTHVAGFWLSWGCFTAGAKLILPPAPDFDTVLATVEKHKANKMFLYPTQAQALARAPDVVQRFLGSVEMVVLGAGTYHDALLTKLAAVLGKDRLAQVYGLTETCCCLTETTPGARDLKSAGLPIATVQIKVVDQVTKEKLGPDQLGEVCVKAPFSFAAYLDQPEATAQAYDSEGFLRTGDLGCYAADGSLYVVDRLKETFKCMDQQVAPAELEELLLRHEAVQEAVVVGVPHREFGEAARAYLLLAQGRQDSATIEVQLRQLLAGQLAYHKQLHGGVEFLASIPQTATGKNLRRLLRDSYAQSRAHEGTT